MKTSNNMNTVFGTTRAKARTLAKELNGKVQDMGADSEKGKRWAVHFEAITEVAETISPIESFNIDKTLVRTIALRKEIDNHAPISRRSRPTMSTAKCGNRTVYVRVINSKAA